MTASDAQLKAWQTLQARMLLAGFKADLVQDDGGRPELIASRWSMTRGFSEIAAAERFLLRVSSATPGLAVAPAVRGSYPEHHRDRPPNLPNL